MSTLTAAAFLAMAASCQSAVDPGTMLKIATTESGLHPFALHDNADNRSYFPETKPEAFRIASSLMDAGHSVDVGLTGINRWNFAWLGLSLSSALDPCANIKAGATVLVSYSRYNTGSPSKGITNGYAMTVQSVRADQGSGQSVFRQMWSNPFAGPARTGRDLTETIK